MCLEIAVKLGNILTLNRTLCYFRLIGMLGNAQNRWALSSKTYVRYLVKRSDTNLPGAPHEESNRSSLLCHASVRSQETWPGALNYRLWPVVDGQGRISAHDLFC